VDWLDNQAGCKGVCNRISNAQADKIASAAALSQWCKDDECLDQIMVEQLDQRLKALQAAGEPQGTVLVLHQMGSHGPAYHRRSSPANKRFLPECATHVTSTAAAVNWSTCTTTASSRPTISSAAPSTGCRRSRIALRPG
jgi:lipid A ethanolaminephosphotransferase